MGRYEIMDFTNPHSVGQMNKMMRELYGRIAYVEQSMPQGSLGLMSAAAGTPEHAPPANNQQKEVQ